MDENPATHNLQMKQMHKEKRGRKRIGGDPRLVLIIKVGVTLEYLLLVSIHHSRNTSSLIHIDLHI